MPAKNLISLSSVKVRKIALIQLRKNLTSRNTDTHTGKTALHPDPKNPTTFSEKRILPNPPNPKAADVLSVRKKGISQEFVQTALINQFVSLNIYKVPRCSPTMMMLNLSFQNMKIMTSKLLLFLQKITLTQKVFQ